MISIADNLRNQTYKLIEPVLDMAGCPDVLVAQGKLILSAVDKFSEDTGNYPNLIHVQNELLAIRKQVEEFMIVIQKFQYTPYKDNRPL